MEFVLAHHIPLPAAPKPVLKLTKIEDGEIVFQSKDLKLKRWVETHSNIKEFVLTLPDHIPDRYPHAIRYFGFLAPGAKGRTELTNASAQQPHSLMMPSMTNLLLGISQSVLRNLVLWRA